VETVESRGKSRRQQRNSPGKKEKKGSHFRTVRFGGFEEGQIICYLWEIVKALEVDGAGNGKAERSRKLEKQMRGRIRVEMRRYFARRRRRNVKLILSLLSVVLCAGWLFGFVIGIDRVSGMSMYPYLNHGDVIVYRRMEKGIHRDDVVVFEKNGESLVKRVAGLPGDWVEINPSGSRVTVNGEQAAGQYVTLSDTEREEEEQTGAPQTVMDGQYLVLGDNRAVSVDSRDSRIGTVPEEDVLGKVILIIRAGR